MVFVNEADALCAVGVDELSGVEEVFGRGGGDERDGGLEGECRVDDTESSGRDAEPGAGVRDTEVAGDRDLGATTDAPAGDVRDGRFGEGSESVVRSAIGGLVV